MMRCSFCGQLNSDQAPFCQKCGTALEAKRGVLYDLASFISDLILLLFGVVLLAAVAMLVGEAAPVIKEQFPAMIDSGMKAGKYLATLFQRQPGPTPTPQPRLTETDVRAIVHSFLKANPHIVNPNLALLAQ